ncbi:hypothetical protein OS493_016450 [Desmophyllum pertusum]|uniref:Uncharacterized protein n=1 Tax=Desmophyllum pertusum TaxID=174260 RepID=A0A9W9ZQ00_9CNID|nr:hypothetical protein OS493_016450 [Desmophyllum pertusum]
MLILNQGSAPMSFLESHIKQFVACKLAPKMPGCELILEPASGEVINKLSSQQYSYFNWPYPRRHYV